MSVSFLLLVVVLLFWSKSPATWLELKDFPPDRASKKTQKNCGLFPASKAGLDFAAIYDHPSVALFTIEGDFRYKIVRKIFEGGMGVVYEAEQPAPHSSSASPSRSSARISPARKVHRELHRRGQARR